MCLGTVEPSGSTSGPSLGGCRALPCCLVPPPPLPHRGSTRARTQPLRLPSAPFMGTEGPFLETGLGCFLTLRQGELFAQQNFSNETMLLSG